VCLGNAPVDYGYQRQANLETTPTTCQTPTTPTGAIPSGMGYTGCLHFQMTWLTNCVQEATLWPRADVKEQDLFAYCTTTCELELGCRFTKITKFLL